jgi:predicted metal-dependent hydrolase
MITQVKLGDIAVDVVLKDIKNIHLSVYPPTGRVRISAPARMNLDTIRVFAISKLGWIKKQQVKLQAQERETPREYLNRESHYVWGKRYLMTVIEVNESPNVTLKHNKMILKVRPGTNEEKRQAIVGEWYRWQLKKMLPPLIEKWEHLMGVQVKRFFVRRMRTRWGTCNPRLNSIRLNTDLAKKPRESLEYVVVHEMAHLLEPSHNANFITLIDQYMPNWQFYRNQLNRLPVNHENWVY